MKKILLTLFIVSLFIPSVLAVTVISEYDTNLDQYEMDKMHEITITAEADNEITAEHGISLMLDADRRVLWNNNDLTLSGSAVDNGRVASVVSPDYSNDYKIVNIFVAEDFLADEFVVIENLYIRAYDREVTSRPVRVDFDGDQVFDAEDNYRYRVSANVKIDVVPPLPIGDLEYVFSADDTVLTFTWVNPPDYDAKGNYVNYSIVRGEDTLTEEDIYLAYENEYILDGLELGDEVIFGVYSVDRKRANEPVEIVVNVPIEEIIEEPVEEPTEPVEESELDELDRLMNYYKIRYSIKCMPSGVPASETDSSCLWARIDLVYAQELLERDDTDASLTDRDKELMAKRLQYPEGRYQDNCIDSSDPASYCSALGKALERIHYFVD